jgi:hypothetical protein
MFIVVLVMYFTILNRIKYLVETNKAYHEMIENNNNRKNDIKQQIINELQNNCQIDYTNLFERVQ